jgi:hypothetical protein
VTADATELLEHLDDVPASTAPSRNGHGAERFRVTFNDKGKLLLPDVPAHDDHGGMCRWLTSVFNLNPTHPIIGGKREGLRGPEGHIVLERAGAPAIRFEPASKINTAAKLIENLSWRMIETDGAVHALKGEHCRSIAHVVRMLCGAHEAMSEKQEAAAIVGDFMLAAVAVEGFTTYGNSEQRYEAAMRLRRDVDETTGRALGPPKYLIDAATVDECTGELVGAGEIVISVSDLQDAARRHVGSSLPRGWLDGRMETLGWRRTILDGHQQPGRAGRQGHHATVNAYRGRLPGSDEQDHPVNVAVTK